VSSYFKSKLSFSEAEILEYIRTAVQSEKLQVVERHYLMDLLESVCILQRDGLFITFSHRSFQEYFAAFYISRSPPTDIGNLLDNFCRRGHEDNVILMTFDMNRPLIEREWILPRINDLSRQIRKVRTYDNIIGLAKSMGMGLMLGYRSGEWEVYFVIDESDRIKNHGYFTATLLRLYQDLLAKKFVVNLGKEDQSVINTQLKNQKTSSYVTLKSNDQQWLRHTSLAESVPRVRDALLDLAAIVKGSVSQQEKLVGVLFE
jgi:hypothetical protein